MSSSNSLVLGLGNRLSGADGFGPSVIDALAAEGNLPPGVELLDAHTDLIAHLHRFAACDQAILIDTVLHDTTLGVAVFDEPTFSSWDVGSTGAHGMSAVMAVRMFRTLQKKGTPPRPRITLVAYQVTEPDFATPPSDAVIGSAVEAVRQLLMAVEHDLHG